MRRLLNPEIALGFLLATVLWMGVLGWQASYAPTDSEKRQCEETARHGGHKTEDCKTFWERSTSDPVAFFTLWLVIFTGGLGVSTLLLWRAGEKQGRHLEGTAQKQLRAYVTAKSCRVQNLGTEPQAHIELENGGQTPAFELTFFGDFLADPDRPLRSPRIMSSGTVGAGRKVNLAIAAIFPLNPQDVEAINAGRMMFFVRGRAKYKDVFGIEHTTNIKFARGKMYGALPPEGGLAMCEDGNESD